MLPEVLIIALPLQKAADNSDILRTWATKFAVARNLKLPRGEIIYSDTGKPRFAQGAVEFSISHSSAYWLCALAPEPVGLDLQYHKDCNREGIARRFFHPREYDYAAKNGVRGFFQVWTAKESYVKFTGQGIAGGFRDFTTISPTGSLGPCGEGFLQPLEFKANYSLCLCTPKQRSVQILWP